MFKDLDKIKKHAKPVDFWTVHFCYFFSVRFVSFIQNSPITPDMLTWFSFLLCGAGALVLFVFPTLYVGLLGSALLFQTAYILDCADGQLARYKKIFSENGWRIDLYSDRLKELLIFSSISYSLSKTSTWFWMIGMTALAVNGMLKYLHLQEIINATSFNIKAGNAVPVSNRIKRRKIVLNRIGEVKERYHLGFMNIGEFYFLNFLFSILGKIEFFLYAIIAYSTFSIGYHLTHNITNEKYFRINFSRFIHEGKDLVIFGVGSGGRRLLANLMDQDIKVAYLCDNNQEKWGGDLYGVPIKGLSHLKEDTDNVNILVASAWWRDIVRQLKEYGFQEENILTVYD